MEKVMNGRRCNPYSKMTIGRLSSIVICLGFSFGFHGLLAEIIPPALVTNPPTIPLPRKPSSTSLHFDNTKSTTRATTKAQSSTNLPITPISFSTNPPDEQLQRPLQATQNNPRKSIGYVAEWESEGSSSSFLDEQDESFGTEQVSPLGKGGKAKKIYRDQHPPTQQHQQQQHSPTDADELENESHPSKRVGPGTWHDSHGSWWLFGGQGPVPNQSPPSATDTDSRSKSSSSTNINKSIHYLSDLWLYDQETSSWRLVFRPETESSPIHSSFPENLAFPHVCGSTSHGHIAVFGGGGVSGTTTSLKTSPQHNSEILPFTDDNVVWLFDIPINKNDMSPSALNSSSSEDRERTASWDPSGGLWTSYICCDACLPDGNTTLEFCPRFSREPILWCGQDSLMALQINRLQKPTASRTKTNLNAEDTASSAQLNEKIKSVESASNSKSKKDEGKSGRESTSKVTTGSETGTKRKLPAEINSSNGHSSGVDSTDTDTTRSNGASSSQIHKEEINTNAQLQVATPSHEVQSLRATWWKFDLAATEWEKMPEVSVTNQALDLIEAGDCRTVSDTNMVYILCPSKENILERSVLVFDPSHNSIDLLGGRMELNNAFRDRKVWQLGRSTLHALRTENQMTVLFLAYHKLLDLWIHDHSSNRLYSVENVWKGSSLHAFQRTSSFYKITISFPSTSTSTTTTTIQNTTKNSTTSSSSSNPPISSYSFFMANPRSKLFEFKDSPPHSSSTSNSKDTTAEEEKQSPKNPIPLSPGGFHITIVTDQSVFLPARDASFLINPSSEGEEVRSDEPAPENPVTKKETEIQQIDKNSKPLTSHTTIETSTQRNTKPTKMILGKALLRKSKLNYSRTVPGHSNSNSSGGDSSSSNSSIITIRKSSSTEMTKIRTTTAAPAATAPPPTSPSPPLKGEQKLTSDTKFNPNPPETLLDFPQQQPEPELQFTHHNRSSSQAPREQLKKRLNPQPSISSRPLQTKSNFTSDPLSIVQPQQQRQLLNGTKRTATNQQDKEATKTLVQMGKTNLTLNKIIHSESDLNLTATASTTTIASDTNSNVDKRNPLTNSNFPPPTASPSQPTSTPQTVSSSTKSNLTTITMTKKLIQKSRRIPLRSLNVNPQGGSKVASSFGDGNSANLLAVKKSGGLAKPEAELVPKSPEEDIIITRVGKPTTELETALALNESLHQLEQNRNRVSSWNSSRDPLPAVSQSQSQNRNQDGKSGPGTMAKPKTKIKPKHITKIIAASASASAVAAIPPPAHKKNVELSKQEEVTDKIKDNLNDDSSIHVTLSYTMLSHDNSNSNDYDNDPSNSNDGDRDSSLNRVRPALPSSSPVDLKPSSEPLEETEEGEESVVESLEEEDESERRSNSLTYGSSEIVFDSRDTVRPIGIHESMVPGMSASYSSMLFFAISLSIFATFGIVLFVRRCVKCPPRRQSVLIKEPPPIRYSVIPDELSYHMPIV